MGGDPKDGLPKSENVIARENKLRGIENGTPSAGSVLSGEGIRSASFGLGVLHGLMENRLLEKIGCLSTFSGGGYIGAALTWFRKGHAGAGEAFFDDTNPFGKKHEGARTPAKGCGKKESNFLSSLRQDGNYLAPSRKLKDMALAATIVRSIAISLLVYMAMLLLAYFICLDWVRIPTTINVGRLDKAALLKNSGLLYFSIMVGFIADIKYFTNERVRVDFGVGIRSEPEDKQFGNILTGSDLAIFVSTSLQWNRSVGRPRKNTMDRRFAEKRSA